MLWITHAYLEVILSHLSKTFPSKSETFLGVWYQETQQDMKILLMYWILCKPAIDSGKV